VIRNRVSLPVIIVLFVTMLIADAAPAFAQQQRAENSRRTKVIWTVIGAAAGAGVGMWAGFQKFDQATFAERKITTATIAGGAIGGVVGWTIGFRRSRQTKPKP
jgi:hypothetical protein